MPFPIHPDFRGRDIRTYAFTEVALDHTRLNRATHFVDAGIRSGSLRPIVDRTVELSDVAAAHRHLESNDQFGKIVLTVEHRASTSPVT